MTLVAASDFATLGSLALLAGAGPVDLRLNTRLREAVDGWSESFLALGPDPDGLGWLILYANPAFLKSCGYELDETVGVDPRVFHGTLTDIPALLLLASDLRVCGRGRTRLVRYARNGSVRWVSMAAGEFETSLGRLRLAIERDDQDSEQANEAVELARARLKSMIDSAPYGVVCYDTNLVCRLANRVAANRFGRSINEMLGRHASEYLDPECTSSTLDRMRHALGGEEVNYQLPVPLPSGELIVCDFRMVAERDHQNHIVGLIEMSSDVTKLSRMIDERTSELTQALRTLQAAQGKLVAQERLASLGELFSGFAHEINNPLGNGKLVMSSMLTDIKKLRAELERPQINAKQAVATAARLDKGLQLASEVLDDVSSVMADFELIGRAREEDRTKATSVREAALWVVETARAAAGPDSPSVEVDVPDGLVVHTAKHALQEILRRLVDNALRYGVPQLPPEGSERIAAHLSACIVGLEMRVEVRDQGPGIPPEVLPKIFDPFFTTSRAAGCKGMGLHVAHTLAMGALGGDLSVESEPGHGAVFSLRFPLARLDDRQSTTKS